jgi:hypothetical protein
MIQYASAHRFVTRIHTLPELCRAESIHHSFNMACIPFKLVKERWASTSQAYLLCPTPPTDRTGKVSLWNLQKDAVDLLKATSETTPIRVPYI